MHLAVGDDVESAAVRRAGKTLLSLALIDARNRSLRWAAAWEAVQAGARPIAAELGRLGWFQEHAIARNLERHRGEAGDPTRPKLASILPEADAWFGPASDAAGRPGDRSALPDLQAIRQYLVDTLETTLELLDAAPETDQALHFYRLALHREDRAAEQFAVRAQALGVETGLVPQPPPRPAREPLLFPATRQRIGSEPGGFVPVEERWAHDVALPEFEIDAQAVSWAQYGEFVADGGYDEPLHWSAPGWAWVQAEGRRTPRYVDQMRQGVLQQCFGRLLRVPGGRPAVHLSWFEADAWCRWAGRRLPSEAEWETAAVQGAHRGFRWGEVREWTAGSFRPYANAGRDATVATTALDAHAGPVVDATRAATAPPSLPRRAVRGASFASPARLRIASARDGLPPASDAAFIGFRSCAL